MSGSIVQLLSKDVKDSFLTKRPEITFFMNKAKHHTPFSIDTIEESFNKTPNFSEEAFCELSKYGDLIDKMVLKIVIPKVHILNTVDKEFLDDFSNIDIQNGDNEYNITDMISTYNTTISNFKLFSKASMVYWREIKQVLGNNNSNYNTVATLLSTLISVQNDTQSLYDAHNDKFKKVQIKKTQFYFNFSILSHIKYGYVSYSTSIYNETLTTEYKNIIMKYLDEYIFYQKMYLEELIMERDKYVKFKETHDSNYYRFSWVDNIALAIIKSLTLEIGGQKFDFHDRDTLNDWYSMATKIEFKDVIDKMVGNIPILTTYDSNEKPQYELFINIPFGNILHKGQTIPCVATKYQDIVVNVSLHDLEKCCFFEPDEFPTYSSNININEEIDIVSMSLLVDYIHLGTKESVNFSSKSVETLVEQHRILTFSSVKKKNVLLPLDFNNAVKDICWTIQKKYNIDKLKLWNDFTLHDVFPAKISLTGQQSPYDGNLYIELDNGYIFSNILVNTADYIGGICEIYHSKYYNGKYKILMAYKQLIILNDTNFIYPDTMKIKLYKQNKQIESIIDHENIMIYGSDLMSTRDAMYFTHVQDRNRSKSSFDIHKYSIAINPEEFQPSGVLNFNVIKNKQLQLSFTDKIINTIEANNDTIVVKIIGKNYNTSVTERGYTNLVYGM